MEIWKDLNELYQVSSLGRVKSKAVSMYWTGKRYYSKKECILKTTTKDTGYHVVNISGFRNRRPWCVHQLVAYVFLENKNNYPCVNHINGIKTDNRVENLEWCSHKQNTRHAFDVLGVQPNKTFGSKNKASKKVIDKSTMIVYETINDAARYLGIKAPTLSAKLNGRNKNNTSFEFLK